MLAVIYIRNLQITCFSGVTKHKTYGADVINGLERQEHYQQIWKAISGNTKGPDARLAWWGVWISTIWNIWKLK